MPDETLPAKQSASLRWRLVLLVLALLVLVALAMAWSWSPLRDWLDVTRIVNALQQVGQSFGPVAAILGFAVALTLAVPLTFLTLVTIVAFGPLAGFFYAIAAATLGAAASFLMGQLLGRQVLQRLGGERVNHISQRLASRGILAVIAIRMVPIAPFAIINMVAGASHLRLRDLLIGTALGMTPGTLIMMLFVDQIIEAMKRPSSTTALIGLVLLALILAGAWALRRWLKQPAQNQSPPAASTK